MRLFPLRRHIATARPPAAAARPAQSAHGPKTGAGGPPRPSYTPRPYSPSSNQGAPKRPRGPRFPRNRAVTLAAPVLRITDLCDLASVSLDRLAPALAACGVIDTSKSHMLRRDVAKDVLTRLGFRVTVSSDEAYDSSADVRPRPTPDAWSVYPERSPVVTIMGHVDSGKTTLLDSFRNSSIVASEAGGITQHIGAFSVTLPSGKKITFFDTPGHAAFSSMRSRGANTTDIVVLVVAADDGVNAQTVEAIEHAQNAGVPMIVALNKCDKPGINIKKAKESLLRYQVVIEEFGGDVPCVEISALKGTGLDDLEENIVTLAEVLDLRGDPKGKVEGFILESKKVKGKGSVASILVTRGTLKPGTLLLAGTSLCKARALLNEHGKSSPAAGPSDAVEVTGWRDVPAAGDIVLEVDSEDVARKAIEYREKILQENRTLETIDDVNAAAKRHAAEAIEVRGYRKDESAGKVLPIIVRADVQGSLEAFNSTASKMGNSEARVQVIKSGIGEVTTSDVDLAANTGAHIFAFNVAAPKQILNLAKRSSIAVHSNEIIYSLLDTLKAQVIKLLPTDIVRENTGEMEVAKLFTINLKGHQTQVFAGCRVRSGRVSRKGKISVLRKETVVHDAGEIATLKFFKKDVEEVTKAMGECVIALDKFDDWREGDVMTSYLEREVPRASL